VHRFLSRLIAAVRLDRNADRGVIGFWRGIIDPPLSLSCSARFELGSARGPLRGAVAPVRDGILVSGLTAPFPYHSF
jgi:hypothetical protein